MKRYVTMADSQTQKVHYTVSSSDMYILMYDNGSMSRDASLDIQSDLEITTYKLVGAPQCDYMKGPQDDCWIMRRPHQHDCIIVEAFQVSPNQLEEDAADHPPFPSASTPFELGRRSWAGPFYHGHWP